MPCARPRRRDGRPRREMGDRKGGHHLIRRVRQMLAVAALLTRGSLRQPLVYVSIVSIPLSYFLLMTLLEGVKLGLHALLGAAVAFGFNAGVVSLPQIVLMYRFRRLQEMMLAGPVSPLIYLVGVAVSRLFFMAPGLLALILVLAWIGGMALHQLLVIMLLMLLSWFIGSLLGFVLASMWENPVTVSSAANMAGLLMILLPPVYYPADLLPASLRWLVTIIPTANIAQLMRMVAGLSSVDPAQGAVYVGVLGLVAALALWFVSRKPQMA